MTPDARFDPPKPDKRAEDALLAAWQALEAGSADRRQGKTILRHLASLTGYYNGLSLTAWIKDTGSAQGYAEACQEHEARRWVFSQVLPFLTEHADGHDPDVS